MQENKKTFFITGANGFIGSYLSAFLLKNGHHVIACSRRFFPGVKAALEGATFIEADVTDNAFAALDIHADIFIHLASANDIVSKDPAEGMKLSAGGTLNALKLAVRNNIPGFIFFSTLQVYGSELSGTYTDNTPLKPENDYALNHIFAEQYVEMFSRKYGIKTLVLRPSNIYGKFVSNDISRWTLVPGCFIREAIDKGTITLMSSGMQLRNFISLEQLSENTLQAAQSMTEKYEAFNLSSAQYYTIAEVAAMTKEVFHTDFGMDITLRTGNAGSSANQFSIVPNRLAAQTDQHTEKTFGLRNEISRITASLLNHSKDQ